LLLHDRVRHLTAIMNIQQKNQEEEEEEEEEEWGGEGGLEDGDEDYEYEYEDDNTCPSDMRESGGGQGSRYGFLVGCDTDLCTWSKGDAVRLSVVSCLRQIATHPSHCLSVVFTPDDLFSADTPVKDFLIMVRVSDTSVVSYMLKFNCEVEITKSPPQLVCLSYCGRGTFFFPDLMLPDGFAPFLDFGKVFNRLREELEIVLAEGAIEFVALPSDSVCFHIQELAYITQYRTGSVLNASEDDNGVITGKFRDKLQVSASQGVGYSTERGAAIAKDETHTKKLTSLMESIAGDLTDRALSSPLLELGVAALRELSPEEAMHCPQYSAALFNLLGAIQAATREGKHTAGHPASVRKRSRNGSSLSDSFEPQSSEAAVAPADLEEDLLMLLHDYKSLLGDDFGLGTINIPDRIVEMAGARKAGATAFSRSGGSKDAPGEAGAGAGTEDLDPELEELLQGSVSVVEEGFKNFKYTSNNDSAPPLNLLRRCRVETNTLRNNLSPCIHVLTSASDFTCFKFLIIGPADTPYENGFFIFDMKLPLDYPSHPPQVNIMTTNGGQVRFNPNLYACGKVCLSLLGTWSGEPWDPNLSNINQVLMSICYMIFVAEPYYNEPGYIAHKPKPGENIHLSHSFQYNSVVRVDTIQTAVLGHLKRPDPDFGPLIERILRHRWAAAGSVYRKWAVDEPQGVKNKINKLVNEIGTLLQHPIPMISEVAVEAVPIGALVAPSGEEGPVAVSVGDGGGGGGDDT
jgi:ubiquitin-protein ligase